MESTDVNAMSHEAVVEAIEISNYSSTTIQEQFVHPENKRRKTGHESKSIESEPCPMNSDDSFVTVSKSASTEQCPMNLDDSSVTLSKSESTEPCSMKPTDSTAVDPKLDDSSVTASKSESTETCSINPADSAAEAPKPAFRTLQPKIYVPPIEETIDFENHKDYLDRFFTQRYCIDVNQKFNDHCVLIHSNKVCVITLAPSHPLIYDDIKIEKINFQVSKNVNRMDNKLSGKHKRNAQNVNQTSPLCFVECSDNKVYTIYSIVPGKLLEMNDQLEKNPEKIRECCPAFYHKQCYVAMILPHIRHTVDTLNKNFLTPEQYLKAIEERKNCTSVE